MNKRVMFRKIFLLSVILLSIIIVVVTAYVATYNATKITKDNVFTEDELPGSEYTLVSEDEFLNLFTKFELAVTEYVKPVESESISGKIALSLNAELRDGVILKDNFNLKYRLAASWVNYKSDLSSNYSITPGTTKTGMRISTLNKYFKASGPLPFTSIDEPTIYVMYYWTSVIGDTEHQNYTVISYQINDIETYSHKNIATE